MSETDLFFEPGPPNVLVAGIRGAVIMAAGGPAREVTHRDAATLIGRGMVPIVCHRKSVSRRLDMAILGLFVSPAVIGIYYVAQQVASLPQKLKTSFDPILGPVITRNLAENTLAAIAKQVSQVGFWITAMQAGIALALGVPGEAVMGLVGPNFVGGTGALAFLLAAEVVGYPHGLSLTFS